MHRPSRLRPARSLVLLLVLAAAAAAGCEGGGPAPSPIDGHPTALAGTSWVVTGVGGVAPPRDGQPTIAFDATSVQGSGGCNHLGGKYRYDPSTGELRFQDLGMTAMACLERARNEAETRFVQALGQPFLIATLAPDGGLVLASPAGLRLDLALVGPTVTD
jgi:heat shock protein HslJ